MFPPPVPPRGDVRPVVPTVIRQGTPTRPRQPVFGRRQVDRLPVIEETTPEQSEIILTRIEQEILQKARIEFRKDIDGFTAKNILEAARATVGTTIAGLYYDQPTPNPQTQFWDSIEVLLTNLNAIRRSHIIVGREATEIQNLLEHLRAAEGILLQWQFEEPGRSIQVDDPFHQAIILSITIVKNALRDPSNLLNPRLPLEIEVLRRLIDADRYYRQHLNRLQATGQ